MQFYLILRASLILKPRFLRKVLRSPLQISSKRLKTMEDKTFDYDRGREVSESPSPSKYYRNTSLCQYLIFFKYHYHKRKSKEPLQMLINTAI